jgi:hypothetical protein
MNRVRTYLFDRGGLVALVTALLYVWMAPAHVIDGDNAEFATLSVTGGAAHPSGYPLYILFLRSTSWLPGSAPAHSAAIATALIGAMTVLVLHAACRAWGARPLAATMATALFGTGPVVLRIVTEAEVFALNSLLVAAILWLSALRGPLRAGSRALALGVVAGLAMSNHLTCVLVAPVGLLGVMRAMSESRERAVAPRRAVLVAVGLVLGGLAVGLAPYAYLLVAPDTPMSWGAVRDVERLVAMFMRDDYGGPTAFKSVGDAVPPLTNLAALAVTVGRAWLWLPALAGVGMLGVRSIASSADREPRLGWWMLALAVLVAGPMLVMRFNVPPAGLGLYVNQRFHVLPALLLAIPVAQAFDLVTLPRPRTLTALVATVGVVALAVPALPYLGRVHSRAVETAAKNMLQSLPPGAVVIHSQDELHAVTGYVQWALNERQDVVIVTWPLMKLPWYRDRVARRGITSGPGDGGPEVRLVRHLLGRGVPVFIDRMQRDVIGSLPTHPYGSLIRVLPPGTPMPNVIDVFALNEALYSHFDLDYPLPGPDDEFATEVHNRYRDIWQMIGTALERAGYKGQAARARLHAEKLAPR